MRAGTLSVRNKKNEYIVFFTILFAFACVCTRQHLIFAELSAHSGESSSKDLSQTQNISGGEGWLVIDSGPIKIYYENTVDLDVVSKRLSRRGLFSRGFYSRRTDSAPREKVAYIIENLLKRAKELLGMYPRIPHLTVKIFEDRERLNREYFRMLGVKANYRSYYIHALKTVYTSEEDISDSVIAHEMGHAVIDHYFGITPPAKIAEMLACYVDKHLED